MLITPYLFFSGRCAEAANFYAHALDGEVGIIYRHGTGDTSGEVQHTDISVDGKIILQMSDCSENDTFIGFSVSLGTQTVDEAKDRFDKLLTGGRVTVPFAPTFFSPGFGMLIDQFGVSWIITAAAFPARINDYTET